MSIDRPHYGFDFVKTRNRSDATRLWCIPSNKVKYDEIEGVFMSDYDDCDNCINFANGEMYGLFNIQLK